MNSFRLLLISALVLLMTGCGTLKAPAYSPDYQTLDSLKNNKLVNVSVAQVEPRDPKHEVNKIALRAMSLVAEQGSFSAYLESALIEDLSQMGIYQADSDIQISVVLVENNIDISSFSTGAGKMVINLEVVKLGKSTFQKEYVAKTGFESSFAGAVAIPKAQTEYPFLVRAVLKQVYSDSAFIKELSL
ncbi:hypothetical protein [Amphritea japonica]|uniref:Lipoprotein n=1 Tax=Amphritea japonica ATCC BAA-1530 TaxID=1278309 RepID=A0A7R6P2G6_9GAMM|nr:hypothetical protein [Amphritea japonica]BBB25983.1 conserved hypothetical protein [Amphritea japonica ATCC BAA-1530]